MANGEALTDEGRKKLEEELAWREGEHRTEIVERIKVARDFGDLSENSEFDDAKEEQAKNEARIREIRNTLAQVAEFDAAGILGATLGSTVTVVNAESANVLPRGTESTRHLKSCVPSMVLHARMKPCPRASIDELIESTASEHTYTMFLCPRLIRCCADENMPSSSSMEIVASKPSCDGVLMPMIGT